MAYLAKQKAKKRCVTATLHPLDYLPRNRRNAREQSIFIPSPPHAMRMPSEVLSPANRGV
ncbi:hypothetical protein EVC45_05890 [Paraburkholderia sp. UYCP14C]|uniref:hypothetical protein n=1 Tax=Paraburkholderia sp. UYCP14C TaxID=2511130 RepID=UPI00101FE8C1|nr:hypothetical protein [Paraburkholderia sp. UYCP14C]RZF30507.1 hypothetical protein EVC45_05890 [Paraburkholderia sp. UYCP14C]